MKLKGVFIVFTSLFLMIVNVFSQVDYSDSWEDFFSYNNVKDFYFDGSKIYAVCDNAIFTYDKNTLAYKKISSVHGLSGETTSSFYYSTSTNRMVIGYENGFIEVVSPDESIRVFNDIKRLNITGSKRINHMVQNGNILYISTDFAIIEFDIENQNFRDTFYIGNQSSSVKVNQIEVFNNIIYAATENGIYTADVTNSNLIDFNNWQEPQGDFIGNFKTIKAFNNLLYTAKETVLFQITNPNTIQQFSTFTTDIVNINSSFEYLNISLETVAYTYNQQLVQVDSTNATADVSFSLHNSFAKNNILYLATKKYGIIEKSFGQSDFKEIHPEGPLYNDAFSISVLNNNLWVVYGGYQSFTFNAFGIKKGFSHFNGENWINTTYNNTIRADLLDITIDPNHENKVYLSSWQGGLIEVVNDAVVIRYNNQNSGLENRLNPSVSWQTAISSSAFDHQGDLWVANGYVSDKVKKFDTENTWNGYDFNDVLINATSGGLGDIIIDKNDNKWIETRLNGVLVLNENGTQVKALNEEIGNGSLPNNKVYALAVDSSNRMWIGTLKGLVRFDSTSNLFNLTSYNAEPIIIKLDGGTDENQGQILLGEQPITSIAIDGADNKWFGTQTGGALSTNPSGQKTLHIFNTDNSPLPSNFINKIKVDDTTGKVYFATTKGIVVYNNNVAPFGDTLDETYAYPNPSTKENEFITIDGRHGTHLPRGTNVKILDSAGYLVYETNVLEGIEVKGGKVIWNKKNLAGRKVASGVYIIMLSLPDKSETSICKVAIIN